MALDIKEKKTKLYDVLLYIYIYLQGSKLLHNKRSENK